MCFLLIHCCQSNFFECMFPPHIEVILCCQILNVKPGRNIFYEYTFLNFLISFVSLYLCISNVKHHRKYCELSLNVCSLLTLKWSFVVNRLKDSQCQTWQKYFLWIHISQFLPSCHRPIFKLPYGDLKFGSMPARAHPCQRTF